RRFRRECLVDTLNIDRADFPGFDPKGFTSFAQVQKEVEEFSKILSVLSIDINPGSPLDAMCLTLLGLEEKRNNPALVDDKEDIRITMRGALGMHVMTHRSE